MWPGEPHSSTLGSAEKQGHLSLEVLGCLQQTFRAVDEARLALLRVVKMKILGLIPAHSAPRRMSPKRDKAHPESCVHLFSHRVVVRKIAMLLAPEDAIEPSLQGKLFGKVA